MILFPGFRKNFTRIQYILIEFPIRLESFQKIITGSIKYHKRIKRRGLKPCHSFHQGSCESMINIFLLLFIFQSLLEGFGSTLVSTAEECVKIKPKPHSDSSGRFHIFNSLDATIIKYFLVLAPVCKRIEPIIS